MNDEEYRNLQSYLLVYPQSGKIIVGSGGLRKIRWKGSSRGTRGGNRIIYYLFTEKDTILMLYVYQKKEQEDLTKDQLKILKSLITREFK